MRVLVRHAPDDFIALQVANGMERAGAHVFSVTHDGKQFTVWCKYLPADCSVEHIDKCISDEFAAFDARIKAAIKS